MCLDSKGFSAGYYLLRLLVLQIVTGVDWVTICESFYDYR